MDLQLTFSTGSDVLGTLVCGIPIPRKLGLYEKLYALIRLALANSSTTGPPTATSEAILPASLAGTTDVVPPAGVAYRAERPPHRELLIEHYRGAKAHRLVGLLSSNRDYQEVGCTFGRVFFP